MEKLRIDKWLWAARFFKTRSLACDEIDKGRVLINDAVAKPSREVKADDLVQVRTGDITRTVTVLQVSDKRGPASIAALLYQETEQSQRLRLQAAQQRRLAPEPALAHSRGRPTKRERRTGDKLRAGEWDTRWSASVDR
ncbi:MAG: RNA-binding S4 domain-containing protein [Rhodoferax sp.]|uniref:RNA-binding S4 domain-containing protein n=1 Tax=Rhodoferax sp. TaxID=50421 RepID=UPI001B61B5F1|nr:RNA-binding S4 domain-containing protein [Rhodoferax sp.]MBP9906504.1 RNA-binding S4 domain-containing protein [Rhodoferax sp.]